MDSAMKKPGAILISISVLLSVSLIYLSYRNIVFREELANTRQQCQQRIAQLEKDYVAELSEWQQYLLVQTNSVENAIAVNTGDSPADPAKPALERYSETLEEIVARKYRFLFARLDEADKEKLRQLLLERERVAILIKDAKEYEEIGKVTNVEILELELAEIDAQIQELLNAENRGRYSLLKDSDTEQHHFTQYTLGINSLFPLATEQQEAVLFARLRHKETYEAALRNSGLYADYLLTEQQREQLYSTVENAMQRYKHGFLQEIRQHLDTSNYPFDQYTLLENYTNTEFQEMLENLREKINKRSPSN